MLSEIYQIVGSFHIEGLTLAALIVGAGGNLLYTLAKWLVVPITQSIYRVFVEDQYEHYYGNWLLYRAGFNTTGNKPVKIFVHIKKQYHTLAPSVVWDNPNLIHTKITGSLLLKSNRCYIALSSKDGDNFTIILVDHGNKTISNIKVGAQAGFLRSNGDLYAAKVILSRTEIDEDDLKKFFAKFCGFSFDANDAVRADDMLASSRTNRLSPAPAAVKP